MRKILLLGATGRTGKWLLQEALQKGLYVHVLVRDKTKTSAPSPSLRVFEGTPTDLAALREAMTGCEAVVSALNISRHNDFPWAGLRTPVQFLSDTMRGLLTLCSQLNVRRVIIMSAWGAGGSRNELPFWFRWLIDHSNIGPAYKDHEKQEALLQASTLDWTIVRPVGLTNFTTEKQVKVSLHGKPKPSLIISRKNAARFIIAEVFNDTYVRQSPAIFE